MAFKKERDGGRPCYNYLFISQKYLKVPQNTSITSKYLLKYLKVPKNTSSTLKYL